MADVKVKVCVRLMKKFVEEVERRSYYYFYWACFYVLFCIGD